MRFEKSLIHSNQAGIKNGGMPIKIIVDKALPSYQMIKIPM